MTTPIYYANDAPHIGHAYTTVTADAVARWHRLMGDDVIFLTGTDEHGLKVQRAAEANGVSPLVWSDGVAQRYIDTWRRLNISNDDFIRTTEPRHYTAVTKLLQACYDAGDIELRKYTGPYSVADEAYVSEDEVADLEAKGRQVIELEEENYFFKLSKYEQPLLDYYEANPGFVQPSIRRNEALGFIKQGLRDFSMSRTSISWGVPLPWDSGHVTYVWFDALANYLTAAGYADDEEKFERQWPAIHVIGKDILRFHCVYWPAMLMSAGVELPSSVKVHGFLLVGGNKMSKTSLNHIAPEDLTEDFGVDGYRYHFLRNQSFGPDGDFSYEGMVDRYNADLANNFGNLLNRVATVVAKKCGGIGPSPRDDSPLAAVADDVYAAAKEAWDRFAPSVALEQTWRLIRDANAALETSEPWKQDPGPEVDAVLGDALEVLRLVCVLAYPAMPESCTEAWQRIGMPGSPGDQRLPEAAQWGGYPGGLVVIKGSALFPRIKPDR
ncbi:MAG: class I tRNA ligase family protein [Acidimicrobiales bacterium]